MTEENAGLSTDPEEIDPHAVLVPFEDPWKYVSAARWTARANLWPEEPHNNPIICEPCDGFLFGSLSTKEDNWWSLQTAWWPAHRCKAKGFDSVNAAPLPPHPPGQWIAPEGGGSEGWLRPGKNMGILTVHAWNPALTEDEDENWFDYTTDYDLDYATGKFVDWPPK